MTTLVSSVARTVVDPVTVVTPATFASRARVVYSVHTKPMETVVALPSLPLAEPIDAAIEITHPPRSAAMESPWVVSDAAPSTTASVVPAT